MHARLTIGGKNLGELTVRMEMVLLHGMVSNGWVGGGRQQLQMADMMNYFFSEDYPAQ
jgi:hypothetical protein